MLILLITCECHCKLFLVHHQAVVVELGLGADLDQTLNGTLSDGGVHPGDPEKPDI